MILIIEPGSEIIQENIKVLLPFFERRYVELDDSEAVIKVFSEASVFDLVLEAHERNY